MKGWNNPRSNNTVISNFYRVVTCFIFFIRWLFEVSSVIYKSFITLGPILVYFIGASIMQSKLYLVFIGSFIRNCSIMCYLRDQFSLLHLALER